MIELIILLADLVYYYGIYLLYSQTSTNDFTLTIAIGIVCLAIGIFFSAIPSSMKGVGILSISEWYVGINMLIKGIMFVSIFLSVAFAFSYERELLLLLMVIGICITFRVIAMIHKQDINIQQYIETLNNSDTSQYEGMFSNIVGNFIVLTLLINFHESTVEMIIAWVCVVIYNIIFSYRISKRIAKKWIVILLVINIVAAVTAFMGWNLLTWFLFGDYVAVFKHSLKRGIVEVDFYDRIRR